MYDFQYNENFEPSKNTKEWCLYTNKSSSTFSRLKLPGLFKTTYYEWQLLGFVCVFLIEGVATFWSFQEGVIITAILASIFIDLVLAILSHRYQKDICRMNNELIHENEASLGAIQRELKFTKLKQNSFYILILLSALFKIFWFYDVYGVFDATTLFIMTSFIIGGILHITCTGYAIFTFIFNRKIKIEHNRYHDSEQKLFSFNNKDPLRTKLSSKTLNEVESGRHRITKATDGYMYLETFGVLTDSQLAHLIGRQIEPESQRTFAIDGVKHQMLILQQDPIGTWDAESSAGKKYSDKLKVVPNSNGG